MRKLMPALYNLALQRLLPAAFCVVGTARRPLSDAAYREELRLQLRAQAGYKGLTEQALKSLEGEEGARK